MDVFGFEFMGSSNSRHSRGYFDEDARLWDVELFKDGDEGMAFIDDGVIVVSETRVNRDRYTTRDYV